MKKYTNIISILSFLVSFRAQEKLEPHPDWSLLGFLFKISDEHPRPFHIGVPPPPECKQCFLNKKRKPLRNSRFFEYVNFKKRRANQPKKSRTLFISTSKTKSTCQNSAISEHFQKWPKIPGDVLVRSLSIAGQQFCNIMQVLGFFFMYWKQTLVSRLFIEHV